MIFLMKSEVKLYEIRIRENYSKSNTVMAKKRKTTLLVKSLKKSFYVFWPPLYMQTTASLLNRSVKGNVVLQKI